MKAIGIKMVELQPMRTSMALSTGYKIGNAHPKVYQCNSLARMQDKNGSNTLHVVLEDITPSADNDTFDREKIVVELNQFVNTWNPYVEPKEEIKDEVGEVHD